MGGRNREGVERGVVRGREAYNGGREIMRGRGCRGR
jgi:hypothetical protein